TSAFAARRTWTTRSRSGTSASRTTTLQWVAITISSPSAILRTGGCILLTGAYVKRRQTVDDDELRHPRPACDQAVVDVRAREADAAKPPSHLATGREQRLCRAEATGRRSPRDGRGRDDREARTDASHHHCGRSGGA